jgi:hypothetical protein
MKIHRHRRALVPLAAIAGAAAFLGGCAAAPEREPLASDALHATRTLTIASADGFVVGDALGMSLMGGMTVRLADVVEPFELLD